MLARAAALHARTFEAYVRAGPFCEVDVPQQAPESLSARDKVLGKKGAVETRRVQVQVVFDATLDPAGSSAAAIGRPEMFPAVLRVIAADALLDAAVPLGKTVFDVATEVRIFNDRFKVVATRRGGLPPLPPYALYVA